MSGLINPIPQNSNTSVYYLVYKEGTTVWATTGQTRRISCNMQYMGVFGINMQGEEVPVPTRTNTTSEGGTSFQTANVLISIGNVWVNKAQFNNPNFHVVVKVKDMDSDVVFYVDANSFNANVSQCNRVSVPGSCPAISNPIATPAVTTATIAWAAIPAVSGYEYVNSTTNTAPSGSGTYLPPTPTSVTVTGLTTATSYYFWIKTICSGGVSSAWQVVPYTTN